MPFQVSVADAARQIGVSGRQIRALLGRGQLRGEKVSERASWVIYQASVEAYLRNRRPPGRPAS